MFIALQPDGLMASAIDCFYKKNKKRSHLKSRATWQKA
jgi:hypothetical protein